MSTATRKKKTIDRPAGSHKRAGSDSAQDPFAKLREERASLRSDLQVSRHVHGGKVHYMLHDPIAFRTHKLSAEDYFAALAIDGSLTLQESYEQGTKSGRIRGEEKEFFGFVAELHQLQLLAIPLHNSDSLIQRHRQAAAANRTRWVTGWMSIKIPLVHPDAMLTKTLPLVRFVFQPWFVALWLVGVCLAGGYVITHLKQFQAPLNGLLATQSLAFLWCSLIGLKVWHELGHGYACKLYGGRVPEMGAMLILGTPAAYCDTSAAWSFEKRRQRLLVMVGGMYFESLIAIPALAIWITAGNTFLGSCAFQVVLMASAVTVLFNANPLMKYDGYFILSELVGVQNLQSRATQYCTLYSRKILLGIPMPALGGMSRRLQYALLSYGVLSAIYRFTVMLAIAYLLAQLLGTFGALVGAAQVVVFFFKNAKRLSKYLLFSKDAKSQRCRASTCFAALALGVPSFLSLVPIPAGVQAEGILGAEIERIVLVGTPGTFEESLVKVGDSVTAGQSLLRLANLEVESEVDVRRAELAALEAQFHLLRDRNLDESAETEERMNACRDQLKSATEVASELNPSAPVSGRVAAVLSNSWHDRFFQPGDPLLTVVSGKPIVRVWLEQEQLQAIRCDSDSVVSCRFSNGSFETFTGRIISVAPASSGPIQDLALTQFGGGTLIVDPTTRKPINTMYQLQIQLSDEIAESLPYGTKASVSLPRNGESLLSYGVHNLRNFATRVLSSRL